jgi:Tol biopolymer transport system component
MLPGGRGWRELRHRVARDPTWSPDEQKIVFATGREGLGNPKSIVRVLDLASNKVTPLPGSLGMTAPRWSPDGRRIVAQSYDLLSMKLFDVLTILGRHE